MIDGHGDDAWKYNIAIRADFSSNVLYGPLDEGLRRHLQDRLETATHYPEAGAETMNTLAAKTFGVGKEQLLVTNGATEAIYLVAQAFRRMKATIYTPAFAEYEDACRVQGMEIDFRDWDDLRAGTSPDKGLVFLCNPNNPTGSAVSLDFLKNFPDTIFVVDESYIEFTRSIASILPKGYPNVLVLRSLTKSCRIPGLRLGFAIGPEPIISAMRACKMPWSVNRLALEAGAYIFSRPADFELPLDRLLADTASWRKELKAATGWRIGETDTHYFLIETPEPLKMRLLNDYGLLVRDASNFRGLGPENAPGPHHIRVACQSPEHNQLLTEALRECARAGQ